MNKTRLHLTMISLALPITAFSLGMGDMKIKSSLNQPFKAEISLIDVGGVPLTGIKARLASPEDFERIGLERSQILDILKFEIKKNEKGQAIIEIRSAQRIVDPYLEIVVDLAWSNGQLYRAYTVLLDPPDYQIALYKQDEAIKTNSMGNFGKQPGVVNRVVYSQVMNQPSATSDKLFRKEATYGPTIPNETIWQIAQRYTADDTSIQQVILAIVGTNSEAFTQGNLNGLKIGERLRIPSSDEVKKVPSDLAKKEVEAHDEAWKSNVEIKHVILPNYIDGIIGTSQFSGNKSESSSNIPKIPVFHHSLEKTRSPGLLSTVTSFLPAFENKKSGIMQNYQDSNPKFKAEMDITSAAIDSMQISNYQLKDQIKSLQEDNKRLLKKMNDRDEEFKKLSAQINALYKQRQGLASQVTSQRPGEESSNFWIYLLLFLGGIGIGGSGYWFYLQQMGKRKSSKLESQPLLPKVEQLKADKKLADESVIPNAGKFFYDERKINPTAEKNKPPIHDEERGAVDPAFLFLEKSKSEHPKQPSLEESRPPYEPSEKTVEPVNHFVQQQADFYNEQDKSVNQTEKKSEYRRPLSGLNSPELPAIDESKSNTEEVGTIEFTKEKIETAIKNDDKDIKKTENVEENLLEFEPSLQEVIKQHQEEKITKIPSTEESNEKGLDFTTDKTISEEQSQSQQDEFIELEPSFEEQAENKLQNLQPPRNLVKSKAAFDTLLALAKTYISMDDIETAKQSLEEVLTSSNEKQRKEAQKLLDKINKSK